MEENKYYHIFNKGNNGEAIFFERENYLYFLKKYDKYLTEHIDTFAYCLMPNHFHFLIRVKPQTTKVSKTFVVSSSPELSHPQEQNASQARQTTKVSKTFVVSPPRSSKLTPLEKAFRDFFISYAKSINKKYHRTGSLFQYKFKRKEVDTDAYFVKLVHYIHYNPIKAHLSERYEDWEFSSYRALISDKPTKLKRQEVLQWFGGVKNFIDYHQNAIIDEKSLQDILFK